MGEEIAEILDDLNLSASAIGDVTINSWQPTNASIHKARIVSVGFILIICLYIIKLEIDIVILLPEIYK